MAKLTAQDRAALKPSQFGLPDKARTKKARKETGNYPMPDEGHAVSAIRLAKKNRNDGKLSKSDYDKIRRKAQKLVEKTKSKETKTKAKKTKAKKKQQD